MTIHEFAKKGYEKKLVAILEKNADQLNATDHRGWTPLMCAARWGHANVVRILLVRRCKLDAQSTDYRNSALILAAMNAHFEVVQLLVNAGAPLCLLDIGGKTALDHAREHQFSKMAALLEAAQNQHKDGGESMTQLNSRDVASQLDNLRNLVCQQSCRIGQLETESSRQSSLIAQLQSRLEMTQCELRAQSHSQLHLARLCVGEPSSRANQILRDAFESQPNPNGDCAMLEAATFVRTEKQNQAELLSLLAERDRLRNSLETQLRCAISASKFKSSDQLIDSINRSETKIEELRPQVEHLRSSVSMNVRRICGLGRLEDAFCSRHARPRRVVSQRCRHRVCELCLTDVTADCVICGASIAQCIEQATHNS